MGAEISVSLSYADSIGEDITLTSPILSDKTNENSDPTGSITITGTATEGETLSTNTTSIGDGDGLGDFSYQWIRGCDCPDKAGDPIANAVASSYTLTQSDVGSDISVIVSWIDERGTTESLTSVPTPVVTRTVTVAVNDAPTISDVSSLSTNEDTATSALAVTLEDADANDLTLSAISSAQGLVPDANIVLGGNGANRTVTVTPASNQSGSATITLTVSDGTASSSDTFVLTVNAVNDAPTISDVANQQSNEDTATGELAVTLGDEETAVADLTLSASSSNTALVPDANIVLGGTGASRTVTVTPASNQSGSATITLTVSDGTASSTDTFVLTVGGVNDVPTISDVANQVTNEDTATGELAVTLGDEETAVADLTLSAISSAQGLVPDANIVLGGTGASRTVTVTPASNQNGSATITLTVSDGTASSTDTFVLTVNAVNDAPTISDVSSLSTNEGTATSALAVTLGDADADDLTLSASSSAQGLVPDASIVLGGSGASRTVTVTPASNQSGSATITLTVSDGTASTTDTFVLTVVDTVAPVITLTGSASVSHELGTTYTDAGATSDGGETVTTTGTVSVNTAGTYTLTYSASDAAGNVATSVIRTVTVVADTATTTEAFGDVVVYANNSATLIGQVTIEGEAAGSGDEVAIYVGSELRGKHEVIISGGAAWVNAQVNAKGGEETISFKVYDASTGVTHEKSSSSAVITTGGAVGSSTSPFMIEMKDSETQTLSLNAGWNLVSFYVEASDMSAATVLAPISSSLLQIKNLQSSYDPGIPSFLNTLSALNVKDGYWVKVSEDVSLDVEGTVPSGASISVNSGWNLVGYPRSSGEGAGDELTSLGSTVVQIKNLQSSYDPSIPSFLNTLSTMVPGSGYWLKVTADGTWTVGTVSESGAGRGLGKMGPGDVAPDWGRVVVYPHVSATVLSEVSVGGKRVSGGSVVGAFVGGELRAEQEVVLANGRSYATLNVNLTGKERVTFRSKGGGKWEGVPGGQGDGAGTGRDVWQS